MFHKCVPILAICASLSICQFDFGNGFTIPSFTPSLGIDLSKMMRSFGDMERQIDKNIKPMKIAQTRRSMTKGFGGVTLLQMGAKTLIIKEGTVFECSGQVVSVKPFCMGQMKRFQIHQQIDYCYSNHYSQIGQVLCIAHAEQHGIKFVSNNGNFKCSGSDERPTLLIDLENYRQLCGRLPWEVTYMYYPDIQDPFHVQLPNPDLPCVEKRADVCVFNEKPGGDVLG